MNAYELADELRKMFQGEEYDRLIHEIPEMLRQQADRIAELEKQSEPVAWMAEHFDGRKRVEIAGNVYDQDAGWGHKRIPLYTTPQTKPLSDEEIIQKLMPWYERMIDDDFVIDKHGIIEFARAIEERHGIK